MKRTITFLLLLVLLAQSCRRDDEMIVAVPVSQPRNTCHTELEQLAPYLYKVDYLDIDSAVVDELSQRGAMSEKRIRMGCSSVRNGSFVGRNLDILYDEMPLVVVTVPHSSRHLATLAVCCDPTLTAEALERLPSDAENYRALPFCVMDGINECGVTCNINIVPAVDAAQPEGINAYAPDLHIMLACRYILDHARSADDALRLLSCRNVYGGYTEEYGLHLMISDPLKSCIVEFVDNKMVVVEGEPVDQRNIMTNFYNTVRNQTGLFNLHAIGIERFGILEANYDEGGQSVEAMTGLMRRVQATQSYDEPIWWWSEWNGIHTFVDLNGKEVSNLDLNINSDTADYRPYLDVELAGYRRHQRDGSFWHTASTSVYDLDNLTLRLFVQEDYSHQFDFQLQK